MKILPLLLLLLVSSASAATFYDITQITVQDSGGTATTGAESAGGVITVARDSTTSVIADVSGDVDLKTFTIGGTQYLTSNFVSGVGTTTQITSADLGYVLQPNLLTAEGDVNSFYTGTTTGTALDDAADYLRAGERGMSFSTALNLRPNTDDYTLLSIPISFLADPTSGTSRATFFAGDGADNQTADEWLFYAEGALIASISVDPDNWNNFGKITTDRMATAGGGTLLEGDDERELGIAMMAMSLEESDFFAGNSDLWATIDEMKISIPGDLSDEPKTDYAFFGIDQDLVFSSEAVVSVPEPSSTFLIFLSGIAAVCRRRRI